MSLDKVSMNFSNKFEGHLEAETNQAKVTIGKDGMRPYNLLYGALGGCLYATFLEIVEKKRLTFDGVEMEIDGVKRETPPTTLETVDIKFVIKNASNEKQFEKSVDLACKYCSIYQTISKVGEIKTEIIFE